jgi:type IV pilus assembly protein PilQ
MIEARIVEADRSFARNLGVRLALQGAGSNDGGPTPPASQLLDLPAGPLSGFPAAALGLSLFGVGAARVLTLELSALETEGRGRILSNPRIVTADRVKALIEQGTELPYQAKVGNGVSAVQFRRAGLKLEVEPHITPDGQVVLDLDIAKDSVGVETVSGPAINTKHIQTRVQVENGGTVVIGGIYTEDERKDAARVPWISRLPLIGALFRNQARSERKSELLVFITPSVVSAPPLRASSPAFGTSTSTVAPAGAENPPMPLRLIDPAAAPRRGSTKQVISP